MTDNPPIMASPCQPPLHKGASGGRRGRRPLRTILRVCRRGPRPARFTPLRPLRGTSPQGEAIRLPLWGSCRAQARLMRAWKDAEWMSAPRRARVVPLPPLRADVGIGPYEPFCGSAVGAGHWPARIDTSPPLRGTSPQGEALGRSPILHSLHSVFCIVLPSSVTASPCHLPQRGRLFGPMGASGPTVVSDEKRRWDFPPPPSKFLVVGFACSHQAAFLQLHRTTPPPPAGAPPLTQGRLRAHTQVRPYGLSSALLIVTLRLFVTAQRLLGS